MAILAAADWAEFGFVRDSIGISDSVLSKHVSHLENAGFVTIRKTSNGRVRHTHLQLSALGREAFEAHAAALTEIISTANPAASSDPSATTQHQTPHAVPRRDSR
ncbi:transcriptional regulator [Nocardia sp. 004]|uniref:transcriptional regulator n=1 Tax=Nocardia sp. 004 TaxID=3385978 RepID=UPI0039A2EFE7